MCCVEEAARKYDVTCCGGGQVGARAGSRHDDHAGRTGRQPRRGGHGPGAAARRPAPTRGRWGAAQPRTSIDQWRSIFWLRARWRPPANGLKSICARPASRRKAPCPRSPNLPCKVNIKISDLRAVNTRESSLGTVDYASNNVVLDLGFQWLLGIFLRRITLIWLMGRRTVAENGWWEFGRLRELRRLMGTRTVAESLTVDGNLDGWRNTDGWCLLRRLLMRSMTAKENFDGWHQFWRILTLTGIPTVDRNVYGWFQASMAG